MPAYAGKPWKDETGKLTLFQRPSKTGHGKFYYRIQIPGQPRVEGLLANEFQYSEAHYRDLSREYEVNLTEKHGAPPYHVVRFGKRLLYRLREKVGKGEDLRTTRVPTLHTAAERFIRELEGEHEAGQIGSKKLVRYRGFLQRFVIAYDGFDR